MSMAHRNGWLSVSSAATAVGISTSLPSGLVIESSALSREMPIAAMSSFPNQGRCTLGGCDGDKSDRRHIRRRIAQITRPAIRPEQAILIEVGFVDVLRGVRCGSVLPPLGRQGHGNSASQLAHMIGALSTLIRQGRFQRVRFYQATGNESPSAGDRKHGYRQQVFRPEAASSRPRPLSDWICFHRAGGETGRPGASVCVAIMTIAGRREWD